MKLISWNTRGCSNPRKWRTLNRKIKQENPDILLLQETKCSCEALEKTRSKIWKGSKVMDLDATGKLGEIAIFWHPQVVDFTDWRANKFSLMADFQHLDSRVKGTIVNVYGLSSFPEKQAFIDFLNWTKHQSEGGRWVMGGDFNLIANLGEKKGGQRTLDKYQ